jgi:hypothetical protein
MKKHEIYLNSKSLLIAISKEARAQYGTNDKPMQRQIINDNADSIRRQIDFYAMRERISAKMASLYCNWIDSLACRLHP